MNKKDEEIFFPDVDVKILKYRKERRPIYKLAYYTIKCSRAKKDEEEEEKEVSL